MSAGLHNNKQAAVFLAQAGQFCGTLNVSIVDLFVTHYFVKVQGQQVRRPKYITHSGRGKPGILQQFNYNYIIRKREFMIGSDPNRSWLLASLWPRAPPLTPPEAQAL